MDVDLSPMVDNQCDLTHRPRIAYVYQFSAQLLGIVMESIDTTVLHVGRQMPWHYRCLQPSDLDEVKLMCSAIFPVQYPDYWYMDVTSGCRYFTLAAVAPHTGNIIGLIVCDIRCIEQVNQEDQPLLSRDQSNKQGVRVAYILSLGVLESYRRQNLGSNLLSELMRHLLQHDMMCVKAVYLHVLDENKPAIRFYEKHGFYRHIYLPYYYTINGRLADGSSYVLYINGGEPFLRSNLSLGSLVRSTLSLVQSIVRLPVRLIFTLVGKLSANRWAVLNS